MTENGRSREVVGHIVLNEGGHDGRFNLTGQLLPIKIQSTDATQSDGYHEQRPENSSGCLLEFGAEQKSTIQERKSPLIQIKCKLLAN